MKKIVFICSHLYSGSGMLYNAMNSHSKIQGYKADALNRYISPIDLIGLTNFKHKVKNRSAIYMDEILYNFQISSKDIYHYCKFIYLVARPVNTINFIISHDKKNPNYAVLYYKFRLRRLCEMAKRTPGAVFLTYDQLFESKVMDLISEYLDLSDPILFDPSSLEFFNRGFGTDLLGLNLRSEVENTYEKYLYFLKNQSLRLLP